MFYSPKVKLPKLGEVVRVTGIVRYGRRKRIMAAKRMVVFGDNFSESTEWIALEDSAYSETIVLREVIRWEYF